MKVSDTSWWDETVVAASERNDFFGRIQSWPLEHDYRLRVEAIAVYEVHVTAESLEDALRSFNDDPSDYLSGKVAVDGWCEDAEPATGGGDVEGPFTQPCEGGKCITYRSGPYFHTQHREPCPLDHYRAGAA